MAHVWTLLPLFLSLHVAAGALKMQELDFRRLSSTSFQEMRDNRHVLDTELGLRVDMMHRDHVDSPLRDSGASSFADRLRKAVLRSRSRAQSLRSSLGYPGMSSKDFKAPVSIGNGEYVMALELGTPVQRFSVIVDTGSDLTWVQCSPCPMCFRQPDPFFDPSKSSSYRSLGCSNTLCQALPIVQTCSPSCQYFYEYGDQSTTVGTFSSESLTLSSTSGGFQQISNVAFGCGHNNQGTFSNVDGLLGLGQGPISFTSQFSSLFENKFSYCLVSLYDSPSQTSPLIFGSAALPSGLVQYTPLVRNSQHPTYYYVGLQGISVGGNRLAIPSNVFAIDSSGAGGTIIDSGTTITQLVDTAYNVLVQAFQDGVPYPQVSGSAIGLDLCFDASGASVVSVPTLTLHWTNADMDLPGENYFVTVDNVGTICLAMAGSSGFTILGNIQQQNFQIVYDRSAQRVGFKSVDCNNVG